MHSSARSELESELAESRIETKLPIGEQRLLHACFTDVRDSDVGRADAGDAGRAAMRCRCMSGLTGHGGHIPIEPIRPAKLDANAKLGGLRCRRRPRKRDLMALRLKGDPHNHHVHARYASAFPCS